MYLLKDIQQRPIKKTDLQKISPALYKKLITLQAQEKLDNRY